jgi:hypothetical protein
MEVCRACLWIHNTIPVIIKNVFVYTKFISLHFQKIYELEFWAQMQMKRYLLMFCMKTLSKLYFYSS